MNRFLHVVLTILLWVTSGIAAVITLVVILAAIVTLVKLIAALFGWK